jgi:hypothetical protein
MHPEPITGMGASPWNPAYRVAYVLTAIVRFAIRDHRHPQPRRHRATYKPIK